MPKSLRKRRKFMDDNSKRNKLISKRCRMSTRKISSHSHKCALLLRKLYSPKKKKNSNFFHVLTCDKESLVSPSKDTQTSFEREIWTVLIWLSSDVTVNLKSWDTTTSANFTCSPLERHKGGRWHCRVLSLGDLHNNIRTLRYKCVGEPASN
jgi:hypothetical protein